MCIVKKQYCSRVHRVKQSVGLLIGVHLKPLISEESPKPVILQQLPLLCLLLVPDLLPVYRQLHEQVLVDLWHLRLQLDSTLPLLLNPFPHLRVKIIKSTHLRIRDYITISLTVSVALAGLAEAAFL